MRRTTVEIDDELLHQAQEALGTKGLKDTVDMALREANRRHLRKRLTARLDPRHDRLGMSARAAR